MTRALTAIFLPVFLAGCAQPQARLTVAAASNLAEVLTVAGKQFQAESGVEIAFSYGSTTQLAQQIEHGAPFDLFAAADAVNIDRLIAKGKIEPASRAVYARGQLAMWAPAGGATGLSWLSSPRVRFVSVANPSLAPYGAAAVEALKNSGLWPSIQPKLVYANNIQMAKQQAETGNADVALTAYSLLLRERGSVSRVDPHLHKPILQVLGIVTASARRSEAERFRNFLLGRSGQTFFRQFGYTVP